MRRTVSVFSATLFAASAAVSLAGSATAAAAPTVAGRQAISTSPYVAMGDSYSSAAGVMPLIPGTPPTCSRSRLNFAEVIADKTSRSSFTDVTCSGADTADFTTSQATGVAPQLDAVTADTRFITMTIGGNDEGVFVDSFFGCASVSATDITGNPCERKYGNSFVAKIRQQTYPHLVAALTAVREKAPNATVAIVGYPRILPLTGDLSCYPRVPVSLGDVPWLNHQQDVLNNVVQRAAEQTGVHFIDMAAASLGHDACKPAYQRWIEPAVSPVNAYPVHPNATGERAMARQTLKQLGL